VPGDPEFGVQSCHRVPKNSRRYYQNGVVDRLIKRTHADFTAKAITLPQSAPAKGAYSAA